MSPPELLYFGDFLLDLCNACVWKGHEQLPLTMKAFAVLGYLAMHPNRIVSKTELFAAVWPGVVVSDWALSTCIREVRRVLHDTAKPPQLIETVYRRGYRFLPTVTTQPVVSGQSSVASRPKQSSIQRPKSGFCHLQSVIPLIGQEAELQQLHNLLDKALNGERQIVFVTGEPGIGKTTLVEAFLFGVQDSSEFGVIKGLEERQKSDLPSTQHPAPKKPKRVSSKPSRLLRNNRRSHWNCAQS